MCKCGCNSCETKSTALVLNESIAPKAILSEGLKHHIDTNKPLTEHLYRAGSSAYFNLIAEARSLYSRGILEFTNEDDLAILTETDLGHFGLLEQISTVSKRRAGAELKQKLKGVRSDGFGKYDATVYGLDSDGKRVELKSLNDLNKFKNFELAEGKKVPLDFPILVESYYAATADLGGKKTKENLDSFEEVQDFMDKMKKRNAISVEVTKFSQEGKSQTIKYDWDGGKWLKTSKGEVNEEAGVPHYTKDGKEWKGKLHKMPDDSLMSGNPHDKDGSGPNGKSEKLYHKEDLNEQMDIYDEIANMEFGMDYDQLGPGEKEWVRDEMDNMEIEESVVNKGNSFDMLEGQGADTAWEDGEGNKVTLQDILDMTKNVPQKDYPTEKLSKVVLNWDNNPEEVERIGQVEVSKQYPILIMVDESGKIQWILDGNHRAQKALRSKAETIPAKLIKPSMLDAKAKKVLLGVVDENMLSEAKKKKGKNENKPIGKPMRDTSGGKAYKVYVRDPKTKKVKTVRFGSGGLRAKINDSKARAAFAARHKCSTKKDKTKAGYWSCRLPRYAKLLGLKSSFSGFW